MMSAYSVCSGLRITAHPIVIAAFQPQPTLAHSPSNPKRAGAGRSTGGTVGGSPNLAAVFETRDLGFLSKWNTLSRSRRRRQEAEELVAEARQAMEEPLNVCPYEPTLEGFQLAEGEARSMIQPHSKEDPLVQEAISTLIEWINGVLVDDRILIRDIEADLYDGQVLQKLIEKLLDISINHPEVSQTELGQRQRLKIVLDEINSALEIPSAWASQRWPAAAIYGRDLVAILRLLVVLVRRFAPSIRLPRNVQLTVVVVRKVNGLLEHHIQTESITEDTQLQMYSRLEHDDISVQVDCADPERLAAFKETLLQFANHHLSKLNLTVTSLETEMDDGVYFILLIGLLRGFFVPLHAYQLTPSSDAQRLANLQLAVQLLADDANASAEGLVLPAGPEIADDVLRHDLKATLRILYALYTRYTDRL